LARDKKASFFALNLDIALSVSGVRLVMESSLARLSSGSSRIFLLLLEKLEPKKSAGLTGSTEINSGLKSLIFQKQTKYFFKIKQKSF
jgi:hypothetical protein